PDGSPVNLKLSPGSSTSLLLTWGETLLPNGVITNYTVKYWEASNKSEHGVEVNTDKKSIEIKDLKVYTRYTAIVRAFTVIGGGPWSDESKGLTGEGGKN
ncbi:unnamed protein product, partial [Owenia fusiformis]